MVLLAQVRWEVVVHVHLEMNEGVGFGFGGPVDYFGVAVGLVTEDCNGVL